MTIKVGQSEWAVIVSSTFTGTPGTDATPDGDIYYFNAKTIDIKTNTMDIWTPASSFTIHFTTNMRNIEVRAVECIISSEIAATSTQELAIIKDFIYQSSIKTGADKVYCWVYHDGDSQYLPLSWTSGDVQQRFVEGQFKSDNNKLTGGEYIWKLDFTFKETTVP